MLFLEIVVFLVILFLTISVVAGVPFMPTHLAQAKKMIELAELKPGMKVIDLGSGAGRLLFLAAEHGAHAVGYELNPFLVLYTKLAILFKKVSGKAEVRWQSIYQAEVGEADIVFTFLMEKPMAKLEGKLWGEMKPGAKLLSYTFAAPHHQFLAKEQGIFVYEIERVKSKE